MHALRANPRYIISLKRVAHVTHFFQQLSIFKLNDLRQFHILTILFILLYLTNKTNKFNNNKREFLLFLK